MNNNKKDKELADLFSGSINNIKNEISKVIVGQDEIVDQLIVSLFAKGHSLLVGVPGLAKTLLINTIAKALDLSFNRIQFTPDLMPGDITGTEIIEEDPESRRRSFKFIKGPVFANIVLADEINRTPPKTQSALLEAMQEHKVTSGGKTYTLHEPFFVLATQNPIEQEGTYPLPEAQLDRFMFNLWVDYPSHEEEMEIVKRTTDFTNNVVNPVINSQQIIDFQELVLRVPVADNIINYTVKLVNNTRPDRSSVDYVKEWVSWGAGPRASQYLILAAKVRALMLGKYTPDIDDIRKMALPVLRHRIIPNFNAEAEEITSEIIIEKIIEMS